MAKSKKIIIVVLIILLGFLGYWFYSKQQQKKISHGVCLTDDEMPSYVIERESNSRKGIIKIFVKNKDTGQEIYNFETDTPSYNLGHPIELHKCRIYVIRAPIYDYEKNELPLGSAMELWRYAYNGHGERILIFSEKDEQGAFKGEFSYAFRIDPNEKYIVLEKSYLGQEDYSLVIKDLKSKEDVFILLMKRFIEQYPDIRGVFSLKEWSSDGQYFWARIADGGYTRAFIRIETGTWQYEVFPKSVMGGEALNPNTGYISTHGYRQLSEGVEAFLSLYNLLTKKDIPITSAVILSESISDWGPPYFFQPRWISDTELKYKLPNGEEKVYVIEE